MNDRNALWFSRHQPTEEQLAEIASEGFCLVQLGEGVKLGSININTSGDLDFVVAELVKLVKFTNARAIFGVPSVPMLEHLFDKTFQAVQFGDWSIHDIPFYAAWNVQRSSEGGKPTFMHKAWKLIGYF